MLCQNLQLIERKIKTPTGAPDKVFLLSLFHPGYVPTKASRCLCSPGAGVFTLVPESQPDEGT